MLLVTLNARHWNWLRVFERVVRVVESGRVLRAQQKEGLAFACASDRSAPASAARSFVALRNMVAAAACGDGMEWKWGQEAGLAN
jgi:hypothetical protein